MTDKRPSSAKARRECFEENKISGAYGRPYLICHICNGKIDPAIDAWEAEHVIPHSFGGEQLKPAHYRCHKKKTVSDVGKIAKSKRASDKHLGIKKKGWGGSFKKKMSGEVVPR